MTAEEWDAERNPFTLLAGMLGMVGLSRKRRLAVCGYCRSHLANTGSRHDVWVEVAEKYADGLSLSSEREQAHAEILDRKSLARDTRDLLSIAMLSDGSNANLRKAIRLYVGSHRTKLQVHPACYILREIFGNPFRPVAFDPRWRSESAVALARTAYGTRNFSLLPILADALEEAGCDNADVLSHCREPNGVHVRGCWVVDGVLGKV